ncbi:MAG: ion transporter [Ruminococcaceae bacterium]|nr:ion transporter [Oscillospiraceae bacterium]
MRKKIYRMVHIYEGNKISILYKYFMIFVITLSLIPLTFKEKPDFCLILESTCLVVFILDYVLRWCSADYKFGKNQWTSFAKYPFRLISIIDLMSILALVCSLSSWSVAFKLTEVFTVFRIIRVFRYSKNVRTILDILKRSKKPLTAVGGLAVGYILISAIVMFNVEPDSFDTFFDAIYWSTVSLTTVGYGDIYPVTALGRSVAMISSFFGIAVVALPAGIVTAEYLNSINKKGE